jgi:hypothetical protein
MQGNQASNLQRWGLTWIVIGFVILVTEMFSLDNPLWTLVTVLLIILVAPPTPPTTWLRRIIEFVVGLCILIVVIFAIVWIAQSTGLQAGLIFASGSLLIGIVLQIWASLKSYSAATNPGPFDALIERIRRL